MRTTSTKTALTFRTMAPLTRSHYKNAHDKTEMARRTTTTLQTARTTMAQDYDNHDDHKNQEDHVDQVNRQIVRYKAKKNT